MDYESLVRRAVAEVDQVTATELIDGSRTFDVIVDVREPHEHRAGAIPDSRLIPLAGLPDGISTVAGPDDRILLYCAVGVRSAVGAQALQRLGYSHVSSLAGGYGMWAYSKQHGPVAGLRPEQRERYARHLVLDGVGEGGQLELLESSVLIVGAGGLGSPAALYLAAAGIGRIGIVDGDVVELSNLQRQVAHNVERLGQSKAMSAAETMDRINPEVDIRVHEARVAADNVLRMVDGYDVIIDATDNFPTRYLLNDVSVLTGIPVVHGSIFRFEGQAAVFAPGRGPCYRCLFPLPPAPELAPNCATAGVIGVLPGIIGSIQATEAIKLILGIGEPLIGRLLLYDALDQSMTTLRMARNPECPACGDEAGNPQLVDYDESCAVRI